jgi:hypothetical protein
MKKNEIIRYREQFKEVLNIQLLGFEAIDFYHNTSLLKNQNDLINKIFYSFYYPEREKSLNIGGFSYSKVSIKVNTILELIASRVQLAQMTKDDIIGDIYEHTILSRVETDEFENSMKPIGKIHFVENGIFYEERLLEVAEMFKRHIEVYIQPFFDSLTSLQEINDKIIDKYPENEWSKFFFGVTFFKVTIIMKLCNNPRYQTYSKMLKERIYDRAFNQGIISAQDNYKIYSTLLEYLDSEEYKQDTV